MKRYPMVKRGDYLELTETGHLLWMRDNNPDDWNDETWRAFAARCSSSPEFKAQAQQARALGKPRPHPTADGWKPAGLSLVGAVSSSLRLGDADGLAAARAAVAAKAADPDPRHWT